MQLIRLELPKPMERKSRLYSLKIACVFTLLLGARTMVGLSISSVEFETQLTISAARIETEHSVGGISVFAEYTLNAKATMPDSSQVVGVFNETQFKETSINSDQLKMLLSPSGKTFFRYSRRNVFPTIFTNPGSKEEYIFSKPIESNEVETDLHSPLIIFLSILSSFLGAIVIFLLVFIRIYKLKSLKSEQ